MKHGLFISNWHYLFLRRSLLLRYKVNYIPIELNCYFLYEHIHLNGHNDQLLYPCYARMYGLINIQ